MFKNAKIGGLARMYSSIEAKKFVKASIVVSFDYKNRKDVKYAAWFKDE